MKDRAIRVDSWRVTQGPYVMYNDLFFLLTSLDGVAQNKRHHPEGDALYHSLQVFGQALQHSSDPELWAAALLHDIGKAIQSREHARIGAQELEGLVSNRVVWLVRHHMDLVYAARRTRKKLRNDARLRDLVALRKWDLAGRKPHARVMAVEDALECLLQEQDRISGTCAAHLQTPSSVYVVPNLNRGFTAAHQHDCKEQF